jgi:hypothetical protein
LAGTGLPPEEKDALPPEKLAEPLTWPAVVVVLVPAPVDWFP